MVSEMKEKEKQGKRERDETEYKTNEYDDSKTDERLHTKETRGIHSTIAWGDSALSIPLPIVLLFGDGCRYIVFLQKEESLLL